MASTNRKLPDPRTLHEWMERNQVTAKSLVRLVKEETGHGISETMMSFILRGSRRCSRVNAFALHMVTKVPMTSLLEWPRSSDVDNLSGTHQNAAL